MCSLTSHDQMLPVGHVECCSTYEKPQADYKLVLWKV